jgi:hypothetical protein
MPRTRGKESALVQLALPFGGAAPRAEVREPEAEPPAPERGRLDADSRALAADLTALLGEPASVEITDNSWSMVSWRRLRGRVRFRLHHMFVGAPPEVLKAVADFTGRHSHGRRRAGHALDEWIRRNRDRIRRARPRRGRPLQSRGEHHDLGLIFEQLNAAFFAGDIDARIGWGRRPPGRRRRSIKMGVYLHDTRTILIHPALDQPDVPEYFVATVVFHEMLHQAVPAVSRDGKRFVHTQAFRRREREFPDHERARRWERAHLGRVLLRAPKRDAQ